MKIKFPSFKTYRSRFVFFTLLYVCFFAKPWGSVVGSIYAHDDVVYYAQTVSLVNDFDTDITNNLGPFVSGNWMKVPGEGQENRKHVVSFEPLGPSTLYIIPYILTKPLVYFISFFRGVSYDAYDPLFFIMLSFFTLILFYFSGEFLRKTLRLYFSGATADLVSFFVLWGTILPVYVFRRPIYGVIPEFFFTTLIIYLLLYLLNKAAKPVSLIGITTLGILSGFLLITRWNDIHIILFCCLTILLMGWQKNECDVHKTRFYYCGYALLFLFIVLVFFFLTQGMVWISNYGGIGKFVSFFYYLVRDYIGAGGTSINIFGISFNWLRNLTQIFLGWDWGLFFTMPVLVIGGYVFIRNSGKILKQVRTPSFLLALFTFLFPLIIILKWRNTGEYYGYRFMISLLPLASVGFAFLLENNSQRGRKILEALVLIFCFLTFFVILPFEYTDSTTLVQGVASMGGRGWKNDAYVINALKFYFQANPIVLAGAFLRGY
ncbi:MAG: hypothetical protein WC330_05565, partial [Candidatus Omnitrophota bacterium]